MATIKELKRLIAIEKKKKAKLNKIAGKYGEKARLKSQLFQLRHGNKIRSLKKVGKTLKTAGGNLAYNFRGSASKFQEQRKKKKGIGGFLQNIADKQ